MSQTTAPMLIESFDYVHGRLLKRLEGLTDDEYFWEPVRDCWTLRRSEGGGYEMDSLSPEPSPAPVTTIAWRLCHISVDVLRGFAEALTSGRPPSPASRQCAGTAGEAIDFLKGAYEQWRRSLESLDDETMWRALGSDWGPFGESSFADLVMHVFDEYVHHAAEVALVRDLYRQRA